MSVHVLAWLFVLVQNSRFQSRDWHQCVSCCVSHCSCICLFLTANPTLPFKSRENMGHIWCSSVFDNKNKKQTRICDVKPVRLEQMLRLNAFDVPRTSVSLWLCGETVMLFVFLFLVGEDTKKISLTRILFCHIMTYCRCSSGFLMGGWCDTRWWWLQLLQRKNKICDKLKLS